MARDDIVEIGVQQRLAAGERQDAGAQVGQLVDPGDHHLGRDGLREIVVFVAVGAGQIAAADGNNVRHDGMARGGCPLNHDASFAKPTRQGFPSATQSKSRLSHRYNPIKPYRCEDPHESGPGGEFRVSNGAISALARCQQGGLPGSAFFFARLDHACRIRLRAFPRSQHSFVVIRRAIPSLALTLIASITLTGQDPAILQVRVVEGEGAVYGIGSRATRGITIQVTDETGKPVSGSTVTFRLPDSGSTGTFPSGSKTEVVATRADGRAAAWGMQWNRAPGALEIRITAVKGQTRAGILCAQS